MKSHSLHVYCQLSYLSKQYDEKPFPPRLCDQIYIPPTQLQKNALKIGRLNFKRITITLYYITIILWPKQLFSLFWMKIKQA